MNAFAVSSHVRPWTFSLYTTLIDGSLKFLTRRIIRSTCTRDWRRLWSFPCGTSYRLWLILVYNFRKLLHKFVHQKLTPALGRRPIRDTSAASGRRYTLSNFHRDLCPPAYHYRVQLQRVAVHTGEGIFGATKGVK